ncbi:hypothetical protein LshimejAT787_0600370 [Lyophyllum shimeji]|uniref:Uncharacterized protein n=1 Tax=Lyophyllum shimeji TaxID=47721 RepID=A0A9P3UPD3_LYOSH|nr:hypothetical protein LshimejAT787_0600370 [Lyophyllum shimeji]
MTSDRPCSLGPYVYGPSLFCTQIPSLAILGHRYPKRPGVLAIDSPCTNWKEPLQTMKSEDQAWLRVSKVSRLTSIASI